MTVKTRLVLFGALLPTVALLGAVLIAGWLFRRGQLEELDRRLLAQAAIESVGLFDGPDGKPHTHLPDSPLADQVKDFAPTAAIYDVRGEPVTPRVASSPAPARVPFLGPVDRARFSRETVAGFARRILTLAVRAPDGTRYTLWLGASLAPIGHTMSLFYRATATALAALGLLLFAVQLLVARRMTARISTMTAFLPRLREGETDLPEDPVADELGALRRAIREVAHRLAEARLEQDRLLASAAHELRSPLAVMRIEIDLALRRGRSPEELREALRTARAEVVRLTELSGALLDLQAVRHVGFARAEGDLASLVGEAVRGMTGLAEAANLELRVCAPAPAPACFDARAMRQAIDNLLGNAIKHGPSGTVVEVTVERAGDQWVVSVADRGPGIPAAEATRAFEPFHRLSATGAGAGLGLAIVREVMQRHGGRAYVDDAYTAGARLVLELPDEGPAEGRGA
ncbi:MAG: HAMP domain-containing sensor histidine kinase [Kofleriaceae bacterium]